MDCSVEINIKLDIFLDSICCLQHTLLGKKDMVMTACVLYLILLLLLLLPPTPQKKNVLAQPQLILEKVLTLPKLFVKKVYVPS
jgi:hypothetical protein